MPINLLTSPIMLALTNGNFTLIDNDDYNKVNKLKWCGSEDKNGKLYVFSTKCVTNKTNTMFRLHRFLLDAPKGKQVDHKNMNTLDNRRENLRLANHSENGRNRGIQRQNTTGYKGIYYIKSPKVRKRWWAYIWLNNKRISLGVYMTKEEAIEARRNGAIKYHGEFRREE